MKTPLTYFALLLSLLIADVSFSQVTSDYDKTVDFTKYKTYSIAGWQADSDKILNKFDKERILNALKAEFASRGLEYTEDKGDAIVILYINVEDKQTTTAYSNYMGGMGYRGGWGYGMGMGNVSTTYSEQDYQQGTLVVDMYDQQTKELVWEGVIQTVVQEKPEKREKTIPKKVKKLMVPFPIAPKQ